MSWEKIFENAANVGQGLSGLGSIYSAINAKRLGDKQIDLARQQNKLMLDNYNDQIKRREKVDSAFANVWDQP